MAPRGLVTGLCQDSQTVVTQGRHCPDTAGGRDGAICTQDLCQDLTGVCGHSDLTGLCQDASQSGLERGQSDHDTRQSGLAARASAGGRDGAICTQDSQSDIRQSV